MRLQMGGVDHQLIGLAALCRQFGEYPVEYAEAAPADEAVVDRLVGTVFAGRVTPPQSVPDHEDDAGDNPPIIDPRTPCDSGNTAASPAEPTAPLCKLP